MDTIFIVFVMTRLGIKTILSDQAASALTTIRHQPDTKFTYNTQALHSRLTSRKRHDIDILQEMLLGRTFRFSFTGCYEWLTHIFHQSLY